MLALQPEAMIRAKAADLGARLPAFRMVDAPELFAGWADRIALADSLRARGEPYLEAIAEADRHIGHALPRQLPPPIALPSDWLADLARVLGADPEPVPRPSKAAPAAP